MSEDNLESIADSLEKVKIREKHKGQGRRGRLRKPLTEDPGVVCIQKPGGNCEPSAFLYFRMHREVIIMSCLIGRLFKV